MTQDAKDASFRTTRTLQLSNRERYGYKSLHHIQCDKIICSLTTAAHKRGMSIHDNYKLSFLHEDESGVKVEFANGCSTSAKILVGADGIWSTVRRISLSNMPGPSYIGQTSFTWIVPRSSLCFPAGESLPVSGNSAMITPQRVALSISTLRIGKGYELQFSRPSQSLILN